MRDIRRFNDRESMAQRAAELLAKAMANVLRKGGPCRVALAGGSSPRKTYEVLSGMTGLAWNNVHFFFSDERMLPLGDINSNYRMAAESLFERVIIPDINLHTVAVDMIDADSAALDYEQGIRDHFGVSEPQMPRFDVLLLGMGGDGHTASLFPGTDALSEKKRLVVAVDGAAGNPPVDRVTFTLPLINAARLVVFLVAGADKLELVDAIEAGSGTEYPAAMVEPEGGAVWFTAP